MAALARGGEEAARTGGLVNGTGSRERRAGSSAGGRERAGGRWPLHISVVPAAHCPLPSLLPAASCPLPFPLLAPRGPLCHRPTVLFAREDLCGGLLRPGRPGGLLGRNDQLVVCGLDELRSSTALASPARLRPCSPLPPFSQIVTTIQSLISVDSDKRGRACGTGRGRLVGGKGGREEES
jgi:hypothetical protein